MSRPRIRTIKPETWHDENIGKITRDARLLFVVLITMADDHGRFRSLPATVLGHGYPYDQDAGRKLSKWMRELADHKLVHIYEVDGVQYGVISGWADHQKVSHRKASIIPAPHLNGSGDIPAKLRRTAGELPENDRSAA